MNQLSLFLSDIFFVTCCVCAQFSVTYFNVINAPTGSGNLKLSRKMMTVCYKIAAKRQNIYFMKLRSARFIEKEGIHWSTESCSEILWHYFHVGVIREAVVHTESSMKYIALILGVLCYVCGKEHTKDSRVCVCTLYSKTSLIWSVWDHKNWALNYVSNHSVSFSLLLLRMQLLKSWYYVVIYDFFFLT